MFDIVFGGLLFMCAFTGAMLIALFFLYLPWKVRQRHDYWCHRQNIQPGDDHGNQEPHI